MQIIKWRRKKQKNVVCKAKYRAYDELYNKLGINDEKKNMYKLAKTREMKTTDLNGAKCIKGEDQWVLVKE